MKYGTYNAESLRQELDAFEARYGIKTETFVALRQRDETPKGISGFDAFVWADTYREMLRMDGHEAKG